MNGLYAGEMLQSYVQTIMASSLHRLAVETIPNMRLYGCDDDSVYMQHTGSGEAAIFESVDTLVLCQGQAARDELYFQIKDLSEVHLIGDALVARTAEEAVYDGLKVAWNL